MNKHMHKVFTKVIGADALAEWRKNTHFDEFPEFLEELQGIVEDINEPDYTVANATVGQLLYELGNPTASSKACSGVLWALPNGTVMHGRNMDYSLDFTMPDGSWKNLDDITFEAIFHKGGKPLFKTVSWPATIGISTAMRFGGWTFEQNSRLLYNRRELNLEAAKKGGLPFGLVARSIMQTVPDYESAVSLIANTRYMAPMYFVMSGSQPYQGAVLTIDRIGERTAGTPPIQRIHNTSKAWYVMQTNEDHPAEPEAVLRYHKKHDGDLRYVEVNAFLKDESPAIASKDNLLNLMKAEPLGNPGTVYTGVMIPATGFFEFAVSSFFMRPDRYIKAVISDWS